ncbi:MAG: tRNA guanosine(15) transglycosylase TgtA [Nitrososphaerota archaeon]|nr:tRNA guanosine(15) transglycosylase TgtA [Nitrososphaerota archaeon]
MLLPDFEVKASDLGGRICNLKTKTSEIETPALLPVIHPVRQLVPCPDIKAMGFEAVMTNSYTTFKRLKDRASEGIHKIIDFDGTIMTDSGGYQVLEFGSVDVGPLDIARFEEQIGSDIAIILDKPTGLNVTKRFARETVVETLRSAELTMNSLSRNDMIWTLPIQGGRYLDLVAKSARESSKLKYGCYALGSPVEVMEEYDFALLVRMILAAKKYLPPDRTFHLFGAGHPLIIPLAVALGCDMFDSASYMLYAKQDRYISSTGTVRLEQLEYLACPCRICSTMTAKELKAMAKDERIKAIATHNLFSLRRTVQETKQAIWEGRLWEYVKANSTNHPNALNAFKLAASDSAIAFDIGTPRFKDRGIFAFDNTDLQRPEVKRFRQRIKNLDLTNKSHLIILPETKTKPFLTSEIYHEVSRIVDPEQAVVAYVAPLFGLVPAEVSDIFPLSQVTQSIQDFPKNDSLLNAKRWSRISALVKPADPSSDWLKAELVSYSKASSKMKGKKAKKTRIDYSRTYRALKRKIRSGID